MSDDLDLQFDHAPANDREREQQAIAGLANAYSRMREEIRKVIIGQEQVVASGSPMEHSIAEAYARLILWLEADHGWDRWKAYDLLTHVGRISVGYYGIGTVAAKVERKYVGERT